MATKVFKRLNDASVRETWTPVLEGYGVDINSRPWLVDYAHNHAIFENAGAINESAPGLFFQQPGSISSMGSIAAPTSAMTPFTAGGVKGTTSGSGDKFPSLMPVAIQVAAKTIGFDLVGVVPMDSPVGFLPYLDYVYQGGNIGTEFEPFLIKIAGLTKAEVDTFVAGSNYTIEEGAGEDLTLQYVGYSRIDGDAIFKVISSDDAQTITDYVAVGNVLNSITLDAANVVSLVSALENHISGFTSVSDADYAGTDFNGPFYEGTGSQSAFGMTRDAAEKSKFRQMGLRMFTKFIEAKGDQVAISASVEQIQDLNRVWNFDVISMLENVAVNELAQSINKKLVDRVAQLGATHATKASDLEGVSASLSSLLDPAVAGADALTLQANQRKVVTKILEIANLIYHRGRFGAGTFVVTNGRIASALADVSGYVIAPFNNDLPSGAGQLYPAGKVYGLTVYVDPNMKFNDNRIIIGRKGADEEPGVKFLPYLMAESLQTISEGTFSPKIGMKSRYAITEAGWHPETQYFTLTVGNPARLMA